MVAENSICQDCNTRMPCECVEFDKKMLKKNPTKRKTVPVPNRLNNNLTADQFLDGRRKRVCPLCGNFRDYLQCGEMRVLGCECMGNKTWIIPPGLGKEVAVQVNEYISLLEERIKSLDRKD